MPWGVAAAVAGAATSSVLGSALGGSAGVTNEAAPSAQSDVSGYQSGIQALLQQIFGNQSGTVAGVTNPGSYTGQNSGTQFAAPITAQQQAIINASAGNVTNPNSQVNQSDTTALSALNNMLTSQPLSYQQAFNAVSQPLQQTFSQQTLPSIKAALATSAGGVNSGGNVGLPAAINAATQNLQNSEGNAASSLAYQSDQANQQNILSALGLAPALTAAPGAQATQALNAASLPQATAQTQIQGQVSDQQSQLAAFLQALGLGSSFSTQGTSQFPQGNTVVTPATANPLTGYLSSLGSNASFTNSLGSGLQSLFGSGTTSGNSGISDYGLALSGAYSDKRLKEEIIPVGELEDGTKIYRYKYKGTPGHHVGVLAQEVEKTNPSAVKKDAEGYRKVDYAKVIRHAAESSRKRA